MILCSKLKNDLWKIATKSQVVTKSNVTKEFEKYQKYEYFSKMNFNPM